MSDRILLLSSEPLDRQFVGTLSRNANIPLALSEHELKEAQPFKKLSVFQSTDLNQQVTAPQMDIHLLSLPVRSEYLGTMELRPDVAGIIFRGAEGTEECAGVYSRVLRPEGSGRMGLREILAASSEILETALDATDQRNAALECAGAFLRAQGCPRRLLPFVMTAADELVMNGIFDAPVCESGEMRHRETERRRNFALSGRDRLTLSVGADEDYVGVSVLDQHGTLNPERSLQHIVSRIKPMHYEVDPTRMGAGLGLGMIVQFGGSIIFSVDPGNRTEVTAIFRKCANYAKLRNQFQFVVARSSQVKK